MNFPRREGHFKLVCTRYGDVIDLKFSAMNLSNPVLHTGNGRKYVYCLHQ